MGVKNGYLRVKPVKQEGAILSEGNEYEVLDSKLWEYENDPSYRNFYIGEIIVVDPDFIVRLNVEGKERLYVKEENVLESIRGSQMHD